LVNDELRVSSNVEALDPQLGSNVEAVDKSLVFWYIVRDSEVELDHVTHVNYEGRDEDETSAHTNLH
jgi:hypothetical protein